MAALPPEELVAVSPPLEVVFKVARAVAGGEDVCLAAASEVVATVVCGADEVAAVAPSFSAAATEPQMARRLSRGSNFIFKIQTN